MRPWGVALLVAAAAAAPVTPPLSSNLAEQSLVESATERKYAFDGDMALPHLAHRGAAEDGPSAAGIPQVAAAAAAAAAAVDLSATATGEVPSTAIPLIGALGISAGTAAETATARSEPARHTTSAPMRCGQSEPEWCATADAEQCQPPSYVADSCPLRCGLCGPDNVIPSAAKSADVWQEVFDADRDKMYYWNKRTNAVTWTPPSAFIPMQLSSAQSDYATHHSNTPAAALPEGWRSRHDASSDREYFWNVNTKETSWTRPTTPSVPTKTTSLASSTTHQLTPTQNNNNNPTSHTTNHRKSTEWTTVPPATETNAQPTTTDTDQVVTSSTVAVSTTPPVETGRSATSRQTAEEMAMALPGQDVDVAAEHSPVVAKAPATDKGGSSKLVAGQKGAAAEQAGVDGSEGAANSASTTETEAEAQTAKTPAAKTPAEVSAKKADGTDTKADAKPAAAPAAATAATKAEGEVEAAEKEASTPATATAATKTESSSTATAPAPVGDDKAEVDGTAITAGTDGKTAAIDASPSATRTDAETAAAKTDEKATDAAAAAAADKSEAKDGAKQGPAKDAAAGKNEATAVDGTAAAAATKTDTATAKTEAAATKTDGTAAAATKADESAATPKTDGSATAAAKTDGTATATTKADESAATNKADDSAAATAKTEGTAAATAKTDGTAAATAKTDGTAAATAKTDGTAAATAKTDGTAAATAKTDGTAAATAKTDGTAAATAKTDGTAAATAKTDGTAAAAAKTDGTAAATATAKADGSAATTAATDGTKSAATTTSKTDGNPLPAAKPAKTDTTKATDTPATAATTITATSKTEDAAGAAKAPSNAKPAAAGGGGESGVLDQYKSNPGKSMAPTPVPAKTDAVAAKPPAPAETPTKADATASKTDLSLKVSAQGDGYADFPSSEDKADATNEDAPPPAATADVMAKGAVEEHMEAISKATTPAAVAAAKPDLAAATAPPAVEKHVDVVGSADALRSPTDQVVTISHVAVDAQVCQGGDCTPEGASSSTVSTDLSMGQMKQAPVLPSPEPVIIIAAAAEAEMPSPSPSISYSPSPSETPEPSGAPVRKEGPLPWANVDTPQHNSPLPINDLATSDVFTAQSVAGNVTIGEHTVETVDMKAFGKPCGLDTAEAAINRQAAGGAGGFELDPQKIATEVANEAVAIKEAQAKEEADAVVEEAVAEAAAPAPEPYDACNGLNDGDECVYCNPADKDCIETAEVKRCEAGVCTVQYYPGTWAKGKTGEDKSDMITPGPAIEKDQELALGHACVMALDKPACRQSNCYWSKQTEQCGLPAGKTYQLSGAGTAAESCDCIPLQGHTDTQSLDSFQMVGRTPERKLNEAAVERYNQDMEKNRPNTVSSRPEGDAVIALQKSASTDVYQEQPVQRIPSRKHDRAAQTQELVQTEASTTASWAGRVLRWMSGVMPAATPVGFKYMAGF